MRIFDRAHAAIADVFEERRLIEQPHQEWRVVELEAAQREPRGFRVQEGSPNRDRWKVGRPSPNFTQPMSSLSQE